VDNDEIFRLIAAERRRAADMFESLGEDQWNTPSLAEGWTVRELAGHMIAPFCIGLPRFALGIITSGGFDRFSHKFACQLGRRPVQDIVATLRNNADSRFTPPGLGPLAPLTDVCVHTRDAGRPLGRDTTAPVQAWRPVLDFLLTSQAVGTSCRPDAPPGCRLEPPIRIGKAAKGLRYQDEAKPWP
jgi:uncharacterized protein (TIGR03083 family)